MAVSIGAGPARSGVILILEFWLWLFVLCGKTNLIIR
jgi:hypothetical protein